MTTRRALIGTLLALPLTTVFAQEDTDLLRVSSFCPSAHEWALLREVNKWRTENDVPKVRMSRSLAAAAHHHAYYMVQTNDVSHYLGNVSWINNILKYGYPEGYAMGEVLAAGRRSASGTVQQWKNSPLHNRVMLDSSFIRMGAGRSYKSGTQYTYYWCATFGSKSHRTIMDC